MKVPKKYHNIRIVAKNSADYNSFNLYLDFSGQREFLMSYKSNGLIFTYFKDGKSLADVYRWHPKQMNRVIGRKMASSMTYIKRMIQEFLNERDSLGRNNLSRVA